MDEETHILGNNSDDLYEQMTIVVDNGQAPIRIDKYLMDKTMNASRNKIQMAIRSGAVTVKERNIKPNYKVRPGDIINVIIPKSMEHGKSVQPENIPLDIRYEDDDVMVVYKKPGMVVHPGFGNRDGTLVNALVYYFKEISLPIMEGHESHQPGLVHRIDKDTSGLLVVAKNDYAMSHLAKQFYDHTIDRLYKAIVWGNFDELTGTVDEYIGRDPKNRLIMKVFPEAETGKRAITHYTVVEDLYYVSLIQCKLETGRTHQIRTHMKHLGHPLFADVRYGGDKIMKGTVFTKYKQFVINAFKIMERQALHASVLEFEHPRTGERMRFETELPEDMQLVLEKWRNYVSTRK